MVNTSVVGIDSAVKGTLAFALKCDQQAVIIPLVLTAMEIVEEAKVNAPVKTGNLRDSIHYDVDGETVKVGSDVPYAAYVEFGTFKMEPQPYLRPAVLAKGAKFRGFFFG